MQRTASCAKDSRSPKPFIIPPTSATGIALALSLKTRRLCDAGDEKANGTATSVSRQPQSGGTATSRQGNDDITEELFERNECDNGTSAEKCHTESSIIKDPGPLHLRLDGEAEMTVDRR